MHDTVRLLMLLAAAALILTLLGGAIAWHGDDARRVRRGLKVILQGEVHDLLAPRGRGRGFGFNYARNLLAVAWDGGAWGLLYRLDELLGAELIVDGQVAARTHRGEPRRALDRLDDAQERIALRLVFDDATRPDFVLEVWAPEDADRPRRLEPEDALEEANRWIARIEALLRRGPARAAASPVVGPAVAPVAPPMRPVTALFPGDEVDDEVDGAVI